MNETQTWVREVCLVRVAGAFEGTGKYEGRLGGLIVDRAGVQVRVEEGFSDAQREEFWEAFKDDKGDEEIGDYFAKEGYQILDRLIEIEFHEVTPDGSLRHPRFVRFREEVAGWPNLKQTMDYHAGRKAGLQEAAAQIKSWARIWDETKDTVEFADLAADVLLALIDKTKS